MTEKTNQPRVRTALSHALMRVGFLRRYYIRRMLKYIDKSKTKGRRLPPEMLELSRQLSRMPKEKRAEAMEQAIAADRAGGPGINSRNLRRAAVAAQRKSGQSGGRYRPGLPPRSMQPQGRGTRRPR